MTKVVLVTGCSTGLGISIAVQAADAGNTVYATMRNLAKREALDAAAAEASVDLNVVALDVQSSDSVNAAVDQIIAEQGRIDVLINNAGAGYIRSTEQASEDDINWIMDVNFNGVVRGTKAVLPHMRKARSGHVITIGSVGGLVGQPFNDIYCAAKFAVEGYTESLASYAGPAFGLHFSVIEPGGIATEFANNVLKQVEETGGMLDDEYLPLLQKYVAGAQSRAADGVYQTADEVASVVLDIMNSDNPPIRARTSEWGEKFTAHKTKGDPNGTAGQNLVQDYFMNGS